MKEVVDSDSIKAQLVEFYDTNADARAASRLHPDRALARRQFLELLAAENRRQTLDLGCGTGQDAGAFVAAGVEVIGLDLSAAHCRHTTRVGAGAVVGDFYRLPFRDRAAPAGWCVSAYVHVPRDDIHQVLTETRRVLAPGAPLLAGVWVGDGREAVRVEERGRRFYSLRTREQWQELFASCFELERGWTDTKFEVRDYLWCLLRA